jgi:hypothetical protein
MVFLLIKTPRRVVPFVLLFCFSVSLYLNLVFADGQVPILTKFLPVAAQWFADGSSTIFYLAPFRAFEFITGVAVVWLIGKQPKNRLWLEPLVIIGLCMVFYPIFTYTEKTLFPSYNALMPCLGTALLIYAGEARYGGKFLGNRLLVQVGRISYSLYLIHWPIIVFYKYYKYDVGPLSPVEQLTICVASILLAKFMYTFVEQTFRENPHASKTMPLNRFLSTQATLGAIILILAAGAWINHGWEWRRPDHLSVEEIKNGKAQRIVPVLNGCSLDLKSDICIPDAPLHVLFLGDSHHYVGYNMFLEAFRDQKDINLITFREVNDCSFTIKNDTLVATGMGWENNGHCQERADMISQEKFYRQLDVLVVSSFTVFEAGQELPIVEYLKSKNNALEIVVIVPYIGIRPYECADIINRFGNSAYCKDEKYVSYFGNHPDKERYFNEYTKYHPLYINTVHLLCDKDLLENCLTEIDGIPMFYDGDHPSLEFSYLMGRRMLEAYQAELETIGFKIQK